MGGKVVLYVTPVQTQVLIFLVSRFLPILTSEGSSRGHGPYITEANEPLADWGQKVPVTVFRDTGALEPNINPSVLPLFSMTVLYCSEKQG